MVSVLLTDIRIRAFPKTVSPPLFCADLNGCKGGDFLDNFTYEELLSLLKRVREILDTVGIEYLVIKCTPKNDRQ
jgi:hypothetical protein